MKLLCIKKKNYLLCCSFTFIFRYEQWCFTCKLQDTIIKHSVRVTLSLIYFRHGLLYNKNVFPLRDLRQPGCSFLYLWPFRLSFSLLRFSRSRCHVSHQRHGLDSSFNFLQAPPARKWMIVI